MIDLIQTWPFGWQIGFCFAIPAAVVLAIYTVCYHMAICVRGYPPPASQPPPQ